MTSETKVVLAIQPSADQSTVVTIEGAIDNIHEDPKRIQQLLDLLRVPKGTEVKVLTTAATSIVR